MQPKPSWTTRFKKTLAHVWGTPKFETEHFSEKILSTDEIGDILIYQATPYLNFYALLAISASIATFGMLADNAVTIVGAMIIAPLMNPIVALSFSVVSTKNYMLIRSAFTLLTGILLTMVTSFLITKLVGTRIIGHEVIGRIEPNLLDLGVAVASGAAAGIAYARKSVSNALPGVAIAVALVPPLCVTGIGLALGDQASIDLGLYYGRAYNKVAIAGGSFLLFTTNLAGIVLSAGLVFFCQGYGNVRRAAVGLVLTGIVLSTVALPLNRELQNFLLRDKVVEYIDSFSRAHIKEYEWIRRTKGVDDIYVENRDEEIFILIDTLVPKGSISTEDYNIFQEYLSQKLHKKVRLELHVQTFETINIVNERVEK